MWSTWQRTKDIFSQSRNIFVLTAFFIVLISSEFPVGTHTRTLLVFICLPRPMCDARTRSEMCPKVTQWYSEVELETSETNLFIPSILPSSQGVPRARQQRRRRLRHLVRGQGQDVPRTGNITKQHIKLRTVYIWRLLKWLTALFRRSDIILWRRHHIAFWEQECFHVRSE